MGLTRWYSKKVYKGICKVLLRSYSSVKKQNPQLSRIQLFLIIVNSRPLWKTKDDSTLIYRSSSEFKINETDKFRDVVRNIIIFETIPTTWQNHQDLEMKALEDISEVLNKEFENFQN